MKGVVLLLTGPMQSWGERAVFGQRDTLAHPTRSGIIGMIAAALGLARGADLSWADGLVVHVRADNPGLIMSDFHMVGGGYKPGTGMVTADGKPRGGGRPSGTITNRAYLADAAFAVTVHHDDDDLVDQIEWALGHPHWPPFLGRKSCPPTHPVVLGVTTTDGVDVLRSLPLYARVPYTAIGHGELLDTADDDTNNDINPDDGVGIDWFREIAPLNGVDDDRGAAVAPNVRRQTATLFLESDEPGWATTVIRDVPMSFHAERREYSTRDIATEVVTVPCAGIGVQGWAAMRDALLTLT